MSADGEAYSTLVIRATRVSVLFIAFHSIEIFRTNKKVPETVPAFISEAQE